MKESLNLTQGQQLVQRLSPRQVQYARILEMTAPELEEEVRRQLDDNPALEVVEPSVEAEPSAQDVIEVPADIDADDDPADWQFPAGTVGSDSYSMQVAADGPDFLAALTSQLEQTLIDDYTRKIALYIIGNLDENGYLTRSLAAMADDIAIATGADVSEADMRRAFDVVRSLEPAGIGAVDLRDCLMLQLQRMRPSSLRLRMARDIVGDYFDLLSKKHYDRLQIALGLDRQEDMLPALQLIKSLNPKPGSVLDASDSSQRINQITPDVAVDETDDGRFTVSLVSNLPQLQVERTFSADTLPGRKDSKEAKDAQSFVKLKRDDAEALIAALKQRGNTLLAVTEAIVKRQPEFFSTGQQSALRPMILRDIAADTGLDLSAVSRATAGKYVATMMGTFPLKMFFNEAPHDDSDESSHALMHQLQEIIQGEDRKHPYSDQALQEEMERRGHKLARRTITKYREKMGIPVGRLRREL